ncbi:hypothetical protein [Bradyrhizobium sp. Leo170]|uniref:hypothetical protein n=1 Tax=Bradyrhizobium sp. Leo170 TaxID=1571199 RepID=UPI00102E3A46|nr:hypothetical protein [Bradyrhizobium sp. Leo170]TAI67624.1 hypothetical protein CWO89_02065 [Bradyrhizobium sp. Leo170]
MKHDSIGQVSTLLAKREEATKIAEAARIGLLEPIRILHEGQIVITPGTIVPEEYVRQAVIEAAYECIRSIDKELNKLGVSTPPLEEEPETIEEWKQAANRYLRVWVRELGGRLKNKHHLIDALAIATAEMREKAELHSVPVVPKAMHEERVTELIQFNNKLEERARRGAQAS